MVKEFNKYDKEPEKYFGVYEGENSATGKVRPHFLFWFYLGGGTDGSANEQKYKVDVGYERFLAPEIFFNPEIASSDFLTPLPEVVDNVIQTSPIDVRRGLYNVRPIPSETSLPIPPDLPIRLSRTLSSPVDRPCSTTLPADCNAT